VELLVADVERCSLGPKLTKFCIAVGAGTDTVIREGKYGFELPSLIE